MSTFTQLERISKAIHASSALKSIFLPASRIFTNLAGYRKMGLKTEDLFWEENPIMEKALKRIPAEESYKRVYRIATAQQLSLEQQILPKSQWLKPEEDTSYLLEHILEAEREFYEREALDNMIVKPSKV